VKHECLHRHLLLTAIGDHTIRMIPSLIITEEDCDKAVSIIRESVEALHKDKSFSVSYKNTEKERKIS
jgi:acetylornithine/N-succinyldiaminopimelate aminotransferase